MNAIEKTAGLALAGCLAAMLARADPLVRYDFEGSNLAACAAHAAIEAAPFSYVGDGTPGWLTGVGGGKAYRASNWPTNGTGDDAFAFAVTIDAGFVVSVTNATFHQNRSDTGPAEWRIAYSTNNSTWHELGSGPSKIGEWGTVEAVGAGQPRDLTGTVYFRLYATHSAGAAGTWRVDNVAVNGEVGIDDLKRVVRCRDFDGTHLDTWATTLHAGGGTVAEARERSVSGERSLKLSGSDSLNSDPAIKLANVQFGSISNLSLSVAFSAQGPDTDDDLYLDYSCDNWSHSVSVKLVDGFDGAHIPFGGIREGNPLTVGTNPYAFDLPGSATQVAVRVRFDERSGELNTNDHYYVDDVRLTGTITPSPGAPLVEAYGVPGAITKDGTTLSGHIKRGYPFPEVTLYWGPEDGGQDRCGWSREIVLGVQPWGLCAAALTELAPGQCYYYRFHARNVHGEAWSGASGSFVAPAGAVNTVGSLYLDSMGVGTARPLCIDRDGNGLSDAWEEAYLGGVGGAPAGDGDGDGVSNLREYWAGTDPGDPGSVLGLIDVDLVSAGSDDLALAVGGGACAGPTPFGGVGDRSSRRFVVHASDSPGAAKRACASVADTGSGATVWVDVDMVNATRCRYYAVGVSYGGHGYTGIVEWAAYVQPRQANVKYLVSVPVDLGAGNNLNGALGRQMARGLHAGIDENDSDLMSCRGEDSTWKTYYLAADGDGNPVWWDLALNAEADLVVTAGMGFWIQRRSSAECPRTNCVWAGKSFTVAPPIVIAATGASADGWNWSLIGWPFAVPKRHRNLGVGATPANQLGFAGGGYGGRTMGYDTPHEMQGDQLWIWENNTFAHGYFLMDGCGADYDGRWHDDRYPRFGDFSLEAGKAYLYRHHVATNGPATGTNFVWQPAP